MKPLKKMSQKERAVCFFKLLPLEIVPFIVYCRFIAGQIKNKKRTVSIKHLTDRLPGKDWQATAIKMIQLLDTSEKEIAAEAGTFSDKMFGDEFIAFTLYCLEEFVESPQCESLDFPAAVNLFFL